MPERPSAFRSACRRPPKTTTRTGPSSPHGREASLQRSPGPVRRDPGRGRGGPGRGVIPYRSWTWRSRPTSLRMPARCTLHSPSRTPSREAATQAQISCPRTRLRSPLRSHTRAWLVLAGDANRLCTTLGIHLTTQKISGMFRGTPGANMFCRTMRIDLCR